MHRKLLVLGALIVPSVAGAEPDAKPEQARLVLQNDSKVDIGFELTLDGKAVPGCFWVMHGRSTTLALPPGKLRWSYSVGAMQLIGKLELAGDQPKRLKCKEWVNKYGQDDASCELSDAPDALPPEDSIDVLADAIFAHLEALAGAFQKKDAKALAALGSFPLDVEWGGKKPGRRRVAKPRDALAQKGAFALDAKVLATVKDRRGGALSGVEDCEKKVIDWSAGEKALSCKGQEVTVTLSAPACGSTAYANTWTLSNHSSTWQLFSKGVRQKP